MTSQVTKDRGMRLRVKLLFNDSLYSENHYIMLYTLYNSFSEGHFFYFFLHLFILFIFSHS